MKDIKKNDPWQLADDKRDGEGCPPSVKDKYEIFDGGTILLYLISKSEIKTLSFYAPDFYEEKCPGGKGRQHILAIDALFSSLFAKSER